MLPGCRQDVPPGRSIRHMADLGDVRWPPDPIHTKRLRLRRTEARDRDGYIELLCSDEVRRYLGGPHSHEDIERTLPEVPGHDSWVFAVEAGGKFIGSVTLDRRDPDRPGHVRAAGNEVEVSYTFLPADWGNGYATEAVAAVLQWIEHALPEEPVVLCTQSANDGSMRLAAAWASWRRNGSSSSTPDSGSESGCPRPTRGDRQRARHRSVIDEPSWAAWNLHPRDAPAYRRARTRSQRQAGVRVLDPNAVVDAVCRRGGRHGWELSPPSPVPPGSAVQRADAPGQGCRPARPPRRRADRLGPVRRRAAAGPPCPRRAGRAGRTRHGRGDQGPG